MIIPFFTRVRHSINGFTGVVTGRAEYATGCTHYQVTPENCDKEGKIINSEWFDAEYLVSLEIKPKDQDKKEKKGGPNQNPPNLPC